MSAGAWKRIDAAELLDAALDGRLGELLPSAAGLYLWRRKPTAPQRARSNGEDCLSWLLEVTETPSARLGLHRLGPCVAVEGLHLGGGGLPDLKRALVVQLLEKRKLREFTLDFIETLCAFTPVLYMGQTTNIKDRITAHLRGDTGLKVYLDQTLCLPWSDLELSYFPLSTKAEISDDLKAFQELLELIAQRLIAPFATERHG